MKKLAIGLIFTALPVCFCNAAFADEFHYNNLLIGDRASGMGGAYTAISDDATGMYYNPAGIVYVGDRNFSASVNAYFSQTKKYENVIGNQPYERKSSELIANYFGIVKPFGNFKVGFSYAVPDAINEDQNQTFTNIPGSIFSRFTINLNNRDNTYNFGPSIAAEISPDLSVGLTLYVHQRNVQITINQFLERTDTTTAWTNKYFRLDETGVRPVLGVMWSPAEKLSLGLSLSQTVVLSSKATSQDTCWDSSSTAGCPVSSPTGSVQTPYLLDSNLKRQYPYSMTIGAAYFANRRLLISTDLSYHTAVTDPIYGNKVATTNVAVGSEYYLSRELALRAGLFTNRANTPKIVSGTYTAEEHIDIYGGSLSISNFSGSSSVTLGVSLTYGKGKAQITGGGSVQNATTSGWLLFLSSSM